LLTNLETAKDKLLQMVLLGQPELRQLLQRQDLRQLAQRITARYHLAPLNQEETQAYVLHRMKVAGAPRNPFRKSALRALYLRSGGVPRLINIIADRALAAAYARESAYVNAHMVNIAANEVQPSEGRVRSGRWSVAAATAAVALLLLIGVMILGPPARGPQPADGNTSQAGSGPPPATTSDPGSGPGAASAPVPAIEQPVGPASPGQQPVTALAADTAETAAGESRLPVGGYAASPESIPGALAELDPDWLDGQHQAAWQTIADLWQDGRSARAIQMACDGAVRTGFACIRDQGNWSRIRQLGLPVLLVLRDDDARLLVLRGFAGDGLLVGQGDPARRVLRDAVEQRWLGEYYVAWPQAPDWPVEIRRGEIGAAVDIVMEMASFAEPAWRGSGVFDQEFETWLMAFQRRNGLRADGIIGPKTLMYLIAPTIVEPRLVLEPTEGS
jgi:general secretion pathway protein A